MRRRDKAKMRLMDLPVEILCDIFKRLPVNSVCCLRCVSKTLLDIVQSPFFVSLHSRLSILSNAAADQHPRLTLRFVGEDWNECFLTNKTPSKALECLNYDGSKGNLVVSEILSTSDNACYFVYFSYCNLFCFTRNSEDCFLIDPFTREVLRLPTSSIQYTKYGTPDTYIPQEVYGMGFDSATSTHKILRLSEIASLKNLFVYGRIAQILELGTNSWREIPPYAHNLNSNSSICAYGDMHWLTIGGRGRLIIVSFDFTKEEFYWTPTLELPSMDSMYTNLIALRGTMAIVIVDTSCVNIDIWVMKDYHKKEWVRDYTMNMHESALDFRFMFASCGEWENGIFFEDTRGEKSFFVDFRCNSMEVIKRPIRHEGGWSCWQILSVNRSLLSLKNYGNLVEARPGSQTLLDFSKNYLWQHPD